MRIFISQPLTGIPETESTERRIEAENALRYYYKDKSIEFLHHTEETPPSDVDTRVWYLGMSIAILAKANVVAFLPDWDESQGCSIEHIIAEKYQCKIIESSTMYSIIEKYRKRRPMTVAEIIEQLSKWNPNSTVGFGLNDIIYPIYGYHTNPMHISNSEEGSLSSLGLIFDTKEEDKK